jgi:predicted metal-dependent peptidase
MNRLQKARAKMLIKHPFFATLLMSTPMIIITPDHELAAEVPTMGTDMEKLYVNEAWVETLNDDEVLGVLAHETMHIALAHGIRLMGRDHTIWNFACDFAINLVLAETGFTLPKGGLLDDKYKEMSADQIYEQLMKQVDKMRKQMGGGKTGDIGKEMLGDAGGMLGDLRPNDAAADPAHQAKVERSIQQRVAQAANVARMAGKLSGSLERLVGEILDPKVPWSHVLRDYMTRITKDDEQWNKRNRRFQNVYLPARHSEKMGPIVLIGDTSGSIGNDELTKYTGEAAMIAEDVRPERIIFLWADTKVAGVQEFEEGDLIVPKPKGGGGTDMRVPLTKALDYQPESWCCSPTATPLGPTSSPTSR